jgi:hypothetical protein
VLDRGHFWDRRRVHEKEHDNHGMTANIKTGTMTGQHVEGVEAMTAALVLLFTKFVTKRISKCLTFGH